MKRTLIGLALSALVTLFFLWLIVSGFGQLMGMLRGLSQPGKGGSLLPLAIGIAVFAPLLFYRLRKARKGRQQRDRDAR
jgi:hypothetical protein